MPEILSRDFPVDEAKRVASQQDYEKILLLAERQQRASEAQETWAIKGKECVEFLEGTQWSSEELKRLKDADRPALTMNKIAPLVRLVAGYHRNNKTDTKYLPGSDGSGTEEGAQALTQIAKQINERNQVSYIDGEVFLEGLTSGRAYFDHRISFSDNDLGEVVVSNPDPFSCFPDPDHDSYDMNDAEFFNIARWVSIDEIEAVFGRAARALVEPLVYQSGYAGMPSTFLDMWKEITPWRTFGGEQSNENDSYIFMEAYLSNVVDPARKNIRLLESQYWQRSLVRYFVDLETGHRSMVPDHWDSQRVAKAMAFMEYKFGKVGRVSPIRQVTRPGKRARWTTMVGDIILRDSWSPYKMFTVSGFFPYFRRGKTRGMVEDLLDPQREINKRRSNEVEIVSRTANGGWKYHEGALSPAEERNLENYGGAPGFKMKWRGDKEPKEINASPPPTAMQRLEQSAAADLREISNVTEYLQGMSERAESGRAIQARQKQAVVGLQMYMDNFQRTKELNARLKMSLIKDYYTEQRIFRVLGEDGKQQELIINQQDPVSGVIANDVTQGNYDIMIDESPLSANFASQQFDELMDLVEKQVLPVQAIMDVAIDVSTLPQKELIKQRLQAFMAANGVPMGGAPPGAGPGAPPGAAPPGAPPGALPAPSPGAPPQGGPPA